MSAVAEPTPAATLGEPGRTATILLAAAQTVAQTWGVAGTLRVLRLLGEDSA